MDMWKEYINWEELQSPYASTSLFIPPYFPSEPLWCQALCQALGMQVLSTEGVVEHQLGRVSGA